jgi:hypothetical protein
MHDNSLFRSIDGANLKDEGDFLALLCTIAREKGRIEVTNCDGGTCVLISKEELDALELALEVLSTTDGVKRLHETVARFVRYEDPDGEVPAIAVPVG